LMKKILLRQYELGNKSCHVCVCVYVSRS
jgi:hypothetical protein